MFKVFVVLLCIINILASEGTQRFEDNVEYYRMGDGSLINAALYNMNNIESYQEYNEALPPPIILLHGFMNSRRYWDSLLSLMLNSTLFAVHPIIAISLRGMGDSQYINLDTLNDYTTNINDILSVLDQIGIHNNMKCIFIGQSFGSMIVNQLVIHQLRRVYGIVLMGTLSYVDNTIDDVINSFKWHDGNNWTYSLKIHTDTNWDVPYNDGRIDKSFYYLMKSEQSKFKYEIMTKTQFKPYDLRTEIENKRFDNIPIILVRGNIDFIPLQTVLPLMNIGNNVRLLAYECDTCDHDIVFGHEQDVCDELYRLIHHVKSIKTDL